MLGSKSGFHIGGRETKYKLCELFMTGKKFTD